MNRGSHSVVGGHIAEWLAGRILAGRKFKRGFGAMAREVIFCTGARSATTADILHQTVADLASRVRSRSAAAMDAHRKP